MYLRTSLIALFSLAMASNAGAAMSNDGFEKGNLSSFSVGSNSEVHVRTSFQGFTASEGQYFAHLSNVGLEDLSRFGGTIGSYMSKTITLAPGQGFSFKWAFLTTETGPSPYNDFALFVHDKAIKLSDVAAVGAGGRTGWNTYNWLNAEAFTGTVTWFVANEQDELSSSHLLIDDIRMNVSTVPEPDMVVMLLVGLGVSGVMARRKRKSVMKECRVDGLEPC
jgi:hypothetical protein